MKLVKTINKDEVKSDVSQAQSEMIETLIETFLPKIKPLIEPATKKIREYIKNGGNTIVIQAVNEEVYAFIIKDEDIYSFSLKESKEPVSTHSLEEIVEKLISGKI